MANDGLGAVIKLGGSQEFRNALSLITQQLRETGSELRAISADFAASDKTEKDITNTTNRYASALETQKNIYSNLETKYSQMSAKYSENEESLSKLIAKKDEEKAKLEKIGAELGTSSTEYQKQLEVVADLEKQINSANITQEQNAKAMSRVRTQMNDTDASISKTTQEIKNLSEETEKSGKKTDESSEKEEQFKDSLNLTSQQLKETNSEVQAISSSFALSDKSEQAVIDTTNKYSSVIEKQRGIYGQLKNTLEELTRKQEDNKEKIIDLNAKRDLENNKLGEIKKKLGESSKEYIDQSKVVSDLQKEIDVLTREQNKNESSMSRVKTQMNSTESSINKTTKEMNSLGQKTEEAGKKAKGAAEGGFTVFKGVLADLYSKAISAAIDAVKKLGSAIVDLGKQAVSSAANYEQIIGGVETLFGDSASTVEQYANNAYKTAGLSANQYMETVTGFSASLLQSLGGDTQKAADIGDMAVSDMADNANKFGTSMDSIQNAYQGFAKQNYTMLDNLKLGYGGTKSEMERLLVDAEKISGIHYDISSLSDVYNAIHVVQQEMGVTGTTAQEAAKTISGSANATKSAWQNVLTAIGTGADLTPLINNLVDSLGNLVNNLSPVVKNVVKGLGTLAAGLLTTVVPNLIQTIPPLIAESVPILTAALQNALDAVLAVLPSVIDALSGLIPQIVGMLISMLPKLIEVGMKMLVSLVDGITRALPQLISMLPKIIIDLVNTLLKGGPQLAKAGLDLILALAVGIVDAIPQLVDMLPKIIEAFVNGIITNLINVIETGIKIIFALINGLIKAIPSLVMAMPQIIIAIIDALIKALPQIIVSGVQIVGALIQGLFSMYGSLWQTAWDLGMRILQALWEFPGKVLEVGGNIVRGLWEGIASSFDWIKNKISQWVGDVFNFIKQLFGIASPSKLFRDEIGANLALGIGEGFSDEIKNVEQEMKNALPNSFDVDTNLNNKNNSLNGSDITSITYFDAVNAFKDALSDMTIELDNENMGRFVRKTVTKAIYA